jgi:uncharacterized protein YebE (UPF0316 family)
MKAVLLNIINTIDTIIIFLFVLFQLKVFRLTSREKSILDKLFIPIVLTIIISPLSRVANIWSYIDGFCTATIVWALFEYSMNDWRRGSEYSRITITMDANDKTAPELAIKIRDIVKNHNVEIKS